jgi:hypothetical protein
MENADCSTLGFLGFLQLMWKKSQADDDKTSRFVINRHDTTLVPALLPGYVSLSPPTLTGLFYGRRSSKVCAAKCSGGVASTKLRQGFSGPPIQKPGRRLTNRRNVYPLKSSSGLCCQRLKRTPSTPRAAPPPDSPMLPDALGCSWPAVQP